MEIPLDVRKHCVETAMKSAYERLLSEYFRSKGKGTDIEEKLDFLSAALSKLDFPALRSSRKELAGGISAPVTLSKNTANEPCILIDHTPMDMAPFIIPAIED